MLHEVIYNLLSTVSANVFPGVAEQEISPPFIVHTRVRTDPTYSKDGNKDTDFISYRVACYGVTMHDAKTLSTKVKTALDDYSGTGDGSYIVQIRLLNEEDGYDEESGYFFTIQLYRIIERPLT